jgi:hypothetical protein
MERPLLAHSIRPPERGSNGAPARPGTSHRHAGGTMQRTLSRLLVIAFVTLSPAAIAAPCGAGTLADYVALGSCEIGATTFSGFESLPDLPAGAVQIPDAAIQVAPVASATDAGLVFGLNAAAAAGQVLSTLIRFQVLAGIGNALSGASATLEGAAGADDGVSLLVEDLCLDGLFATPPAGCAGTGALALIPFADAFESDVDESAAFADSGLIDVVANFIIDGGLAGSAALTSGTLRFATGVATPVAEPGALALVLAALAALVAVSARRDPLGRA